MTDWQLTTPVAFFIFNRPDTTQKVFNEIAKARPPKLLVVSDGARSEHPGESEKCLETRAVIEQVDWDCEVITNYSADNLGCRKRVSSGIDWIFDQVAEAIILEDDCLPHPSFFRYCEELLEYYRYDERIMVISGNNFQLGRQRSGDSYYYSIYNHIWGWASWRRAWQYYDVDMALWPAFRDAGHLESIFSDPKKRNYWTKYFNKVHHDNLSSWAYQWTFACWSQNGLTVLPEENLISNIGFGSEATHTTRACSLANLPVSEVMFPLSHPDFMIQHLEADEFTFEQVYCGPLGRRLWQKARELINQ